MVSLFSFLQFFDIIFYSRGTYTNSSRNQLYTVYESDKCLKFVPSQSGYYEASMYVPIKNQSISTKFVYTTPELINNNEFYYLDKSGREYYVHTSKEEGISSNAVIKNTTKAAAYLEKGKTYYIVASCSYDNYDVDKTMQTTITGSAYTYLNKTATIKVYSHKHSLEVKNYTYTRTEDCDLCGYYGTFYKDMKISLPTTSYTYDGKVKSPKPVVKNSSGTTLKNGTDYTLKYSAGRKYVGKYSITVTMKGKYYGSKTLYFTINPPVTAISSLKAGNNSFSVKWKKKTSQVTGYQVKYSTSSKFSKATTKTITSNKTTSLKKTKLKDKKKYYVKVRTYKTVKINGKSVKYYSSWSKAKVIKTK